MINYFVDNKLGGVTSLNYNLTNNNGNCKQRVIQIDQEEWKGARADNRFPVEEQILFRYSCKENYYSVLKRLRNTIKDEEGVLVLNYNTEMEMLDYFPARQTTYQFVHDGYNLELAKKYAHVVDVFIAHNTFIYENLLELFPGRKKDIFYLPHGVPIPLNFREQKITPEPLQLVFVGRMTSSKGIFDLPRIDKLLQDKNIVCGWTCIGDGPELEVLKKEWNAENVKFLTPASNAAVLDICAGKDVFVLPTKFEGSPVSLLETMSCGLVPVITSLPGGIDEIVGEDIGFKIQMDQNHLFAEAIERLHRDRLLLNRLSTNCRNKIVDEFDVKKTAENYFKLFSLYKEFYKPKVVQRLKLGSRLDNALIPNAVTKIVRKIKG